MVSATSLSIAVALPAAADEPETAGYRVIRPEDKTMLRSAGLIGGGATLLAFGTGTGVIGGLFIPGVVDGAGPVFNTIAAGLLGTSIACLGIGIPMIVVGAQRVPVEPSVSLGVGRVDLSLSF